MMTSLLHDVVRDKSVPEGKASEERRLSRIIRLVVLQTYVAERTRGQISGT